MNDGFPVRIGFIGAGRVGSSLGKYFLTKGVRVSGYASRSPASARAAASFTNTAQYEDIETLVNDCSMIFLTVPDKAIGEVWDSMTGFNIKGKIICHCSGAISSDIFSNITSHGAYGYSIHPLCAASSRTESYKAFENAYFTIEGTTGRLTFMKDFIAGLGNRVSIISAADKPRYHAAAVLASNLSAALYETACTLLSDCGFSGGDARAALSPLFLGNAESIARDGPAAALTGPLERNDVKTVESHLAALRGSDRQIYACLSLRLIRTAMEKNPDTDYSDMERLLNETIDLKG